MKDSMHELPTIAPQEQAETGRSFRDSALLVAGEYFQKARKTVESNARTALLVAALSPLAVACGGGGNNGGAVSESDPNFIGPKITQSSIAEAVTVVPSVVSTEVPPTAAPEVLTQEQRILGFFNRAVKPDYKLGEIPGLIVSVDEVAKSKQLGTSSEVKINGSSFFVVDVEGQDGKYWGNRVQVIADAKESNEGLTMDQAKETYEKYFNSHNDPKANWVTKGPATYERVVYLPDGSFDSEVVYVNQDKNTGKFVTWAVTCNTQKDNPRFSRKSCF